MAKTEISIRLKLIIFGFFLILLALMVGEALYQHINAETNIGTHLLIVMYIAFYLAPVTLIVYLMYKEKASSLTMAINLIIIHIPFSIISIASPQLYRSLVGMAGMTLLPTYWFIIGILLPIGLVWLIKKDTIKLR